MANPFNLTEYRKAVHERYQEVQSSRNGNLLMPALDLAKSLRSLNANQSALLDGLLQIFSEHPQTTDQYRLAAMLTSKVADNG